MSLLDNASLLLTPNAYKEGKLYSVIPSNGNGDFTATRATTATRVNAAGLVDLVPYNLVQQSEVFSNAAWVKNSSTISANIATAPDGTLTADKLIPNNGVSPTASNSTVLVQLGALPPSVYTFSIYAKAAEFSSIGFRESQFSGQILNVDLTNGSISGGGSQFVSPSATNVGNGWYRISFTSNSSTLMSNLSQYVIRCSVTGDGTSGIFIWGAQLVEGTSARDYLRTETRLNIPRVDYSLGGCPNILLEPQRTNLALQSSSFDSASWVKGDITVTSNSIVSPDGIINADTLIATSVNGVIRQVFTASGASYSFSVWLKRKTGSGDIRINAGLAYTTVPVTAEWQRFEITQAPVAGSRTAGFLVTVSGDEVYAWGAQLEAGAYATSYIPTTTASVTRNADSITRNNIFTNGLITAAGGTWFVEIRNNRAIPRDTFSEGIRIINAATGSNNGFEIRNAGTVERLYIIKRLSGVVTTLMVTTTDTVKIAIKWNGTTADLFVNGVKVVAATAFAFTALDTVSGNGADVPKYINEMALFPTPLTDAQLIQLTTL